MLNRRHFVFGLSAVPAAAWSSARMQACLFRRRRCIQFLRNCPCPPAAQATQYQPEVVLERQKPLPACIFIWLDGGPSTIDMWDLKSDAGTRGPFRPIPTAGGMEICEHLPKTAKVMDKLSIVRSMSTREASHSRASYYAHTGCVPNPTVDYPSVGAVIAQTLGPKRRDFKLPASSP